MKLKINLIITCCICLTTIPAPAFSDIGEKHDDFYRYVISKLFKITPDTWEIRIRKSEEPYGYAASSSMKGVSIFFIGKTETNPLNKKKESEYESFFIVVMPPDYKAENYIRKDADDHGPAMSPDKPLGETNKYKIFYRITGSSEGKIPTWQNWKEDIIKTLDVKE
jgi:hypothetical protein